MRVVARRSGLREGKARAALPEAVRRLEEDLRAADRPIVWEGSSRMEVGCGLHYLAWDNQDLREHALAALRHTPAACCPQRCALWVLVRLDLGLAPDLEP